MTVIGHPREGGDPLLVDSRLHGNDRQIIIGGFMMANVGKWAFLGGILLAILAGFFTIPYIMTILAVLGLIVGFLDITSKESHKYLMAVVALLVIGAASLSAFSALGTLYGLTESIITNAIAFVAASGLVVAIKEILVMGRNE